MRKLVLWYEDRARGIRFTIIAIMTAIPIYTGGLIEDAAVRTFELEGYLNIAARAASLIIVIAIVIFVYLWIGSIRDELHAEERTRLQLRLQAYTHTDRLVSERLACVDAPTGVPFDPLRFAGATVDDLKKIVRAAYNTFESTYGTAPTPDERIDFEVTFMTQSYLDGFITIPAAANRDGRNPRSMILRKNHPDIYESTVTAAVYREPRPSIHIVEDTSPAAYQALYEGQKARIRSSIVFPVVSDEHALLGTMVVHCDKVHFFKSEDETFWSDVLEIFAKRLALAKKRLDTIVELNKQSGTPLASQIIF